MARDKVKTKMCTLQIACDGEGVLKNEICVRCRKLQEKRQKAKEKQNG